MGKIRIIGGIHRSRKLPVMTAAGLRPTLDRVKETLFNWLGQDLSGKVCLDLFAGSGSLGFEAVSRQAQQVVMVEKSAAVAAQLNSNCRLLNAHQCQVVTSDALAYLKTSPLQFDVVFLDPPYHSELLAASLALIKPRLASHAVIYVEALQSPDFAGFELIKLAKAGTVHYGLLITKD